MAHTSRKALEEKLAALPPEARQDVVKRFEAAAHDKREIDRLQQSLFFRTRKNVAPVTPMSLADLRRDRGYSQASLAKKGLLSQAEISRLELGFYSTVTTTLDKYIMSLGGRMRIVVSAEGLPDVILKGLRMPFSNAAAKFHPPAAAPRAPAKAPDFALDAAMQAVLPSAKSALTDLLADMISDKIKIVELTAAIAQASGNQNFLELPNTEKTIMELRQERNVSKRSLARAVGSNPDSVGKLEEGKSSPRMEFISACLKGLGLDMNVVAEFPDRAPVSVTGLTGPRHQRKHRTG